MRPQPAQGFHLASDRFAVLARSFLTTDIGLLSRPQFARQSTSPRRNTLASATYYNIKWKLTFINVTMFFYQSLKFIKRNFYITSDAKEMTGHYQ